MRWRFVSKNIRKMILHHFGVSRKKALYVPSEWIFGFLVFIDACYEHPYARKDTLEWVVNEVIKASKICAKLCLEIKFIENLTCTIKSAMKK